MAKPELGTKRICPETGRKFYDLGKEPIVSPYTGTSYPLSFFEAPPRISKRAGPVAAVAEEEEVETEVVEPADEAVETVSLSDVEEDEGAKPESVDIDDDEEVEVDDADDTFLEADEDEDDDVTDIIGSRDDDDD